MHEGNLSRGRLARFFAATILGLPAAVVLHGFAQHIETSKFNAAPARPAENPTIVAHGTEVYAKSCQSCHAADLRGASGPSILRSQASLTDHKGETLIPIMQGQDKSFPNHKIDISMEDSAAVAAYIRSIVAQIGSQGRAPGDGQHLPDIMVGDASRGKQYFAAKCASCHSADGDLKGYATRVPNPRTMQPAWIRGNHFGVPMPAIKATVTPKGMKPLTGTLIHVDDFLVTLQLPDGLMRTFRRNGEEPKVAVNDPLEAHRKLLTVYTDGDIHDVTAYLVTLK